MDSMRIGLYFKKDHQLASSLAKKIIEYLERENIEVYIEKSLENILSPGPRTFDLSRDYVDAVVVIGGDGTVIRVLHELGDRDTPIMTIRMGRRGVLLDVSPIEAFDRLRDLLQGRYVIKEYDRIYAEIRGIKSPPAINEILLGPSPEHYRYRVIRFSVYKNDHLIYSLEGDGVIVATPIGSSAYSLAAGGPLIDRSLKALVVTPLATTTLWARPVVLPIDAVISIHLREDSVPGEIVVDGYQRISVSPGERFSIKRYPKPARIIRFHEDEIVYEEIFSRR